MTDEATTQSEGDFSQLKELHDSAAHAVELLKAMANEWRLMILCQLAEGEVSVGELARRLGLRQAAVSQQLALLRKDGLVAPRREAQTIYYALAGTEAARVIALLYEIYCAPQAEATAGALAEEEVT